MNKNQYAKIPVNFLNVLINYLKSRPWGEVDQLLKSMDGIEVIQEEIKKDNKRNRKENKKENKKPLKAVENES